MISLRSPGAISIYSFDRLVQEPTFCGNLEEWHIIEKMETVEACNRSIDEPQTNPPLRDSVISVHGSVDHEGILAEAIL